MTDVIAKCRASYSLDNSKGVIIARLLIPTFYSLLTASSITLYKVLHESDHHWLNRVGGGIVIISLGFSLLQFGYERWMEARLSGVDRAGSIETKLKNFGYSIPEAVKKASGIRSLAHEKLERVRSGILLHAVTCALVGEALHSFGDMFVE